MTRSNVGQPRFPGICHLFNSPNGCRYGVRCKFLHTLLSDGVHIEQQNAQRQTGEGGGRASFIQWRYFIPKLGSRAAPLSNPRLESFLQEALELIESDVGTMQQTIKHLASEGGLVRIKEIVGRNFDLFEGKSQKQIFSKLILPLFQIFTHPKVDESIMLEDHLGTVYNFIYGRQGDRATALFTFIAQIFAEGKEISCPDNVETIMTALSKVIEWNSHALVNQDLKNITEALLNIVDLQEVASPQTARVIRKLSGRLNIGKMLPEVSFAPKAVTKAKFFVPPDLPGDLSAAGPRHDNDHASITKIRILPTSDEIKASRGEYLPNKDPSQWHLSSLEGLLDRHFRLLREDTVGQLRDAIRAEAGQAQGRSQKSVARIFTYQNVVIEDLSFSRWKGLQILVSFNQPDHLIKLGTRARQEWWQHTKRMQNDALICLLTESDSVTFCTVCEPSKETAQPRHNPEQSPQQRELPTMLHDRANGFVTVKLVDPSETNINMILSSLKTRSTRNQRLVEFPGIILPSFQPTLLALQKMSQLSELSFAEYIAPGYATKELEPPFYTVKQGFRFNFQDIMTNNVNLYFGPDKEFDAAFFKAHTQLDDAQANALLDCLSRSLALIQGPPGTGKSFTGVALIKVLLRTKKEAGLGPILCVCYTNHALDQLLEHLLDHGVEQIIRIGSRSKSERLDDCNLRAVAKSVDVTREEKQVRYRLGLELDEEEKEIQHLLASLRDPYSPGVIKEYLDAHHPNHSDELFQKEDRDEEGFSVVRYGGGKEIQQWLCKGCRLIDPPRPIGILLQLSIHRISKAERESLYQYWVKDIKETLLIRLNTAILSHQEKQLRYDRIREDVNLRCLQSANVIGVTTTGLARRLDLLRKLRSKVLICEEAGEVLEAHILTALLPSLQHVILVGDHLQLPPHIQNFDLSRENPQGQQYSLDLSLFERLVQPPSSSQLSLPFSVLETQRRMHPSISNLIRTTLYPQLQDSPYVEDYPQIPGMKKRLFWLDHRQLEAGAGINHIDTTSHSNDFEIEMVVALVTHLVRQAVYAENEIAILTPYLGQMLKIRRILSKTFELTLTEGDMQEIERQGLESDEVEAVAPRIRPAKMSLLKALKVSTIDNFQGEEAKVVIISLVRSNRENKCGFLKTSNRINVLLSRAKHGMYIIGNSETSGHVKMWADVLKLLKAGGNFGDQLELQCPRHPETPILVSSPDDFVMFSPEGGCNLKCDRRLDCGHACINKCHSDALHNAVRCLEDCPRSLKGCDHSCPNRCGDICVAKCSVMLRRLDITLPCGHHRNKLACWQAQEPSLVVCDNAVPVIIPGCEHEVMVLCHITDKTRQCRATCGTILNCGHVCQRKCYECKTRKDGVVTSENHGSCQQICARPYTTCTHSCRETCHGDKPCPSCSAACEIACSHSKCYKRCSEPCAPCAEAVCTSACPHQKCTMPCASPCDWLPCSQRCEKMLVCGHRCPTICGEICPPPQLCQICAPEEVQSIIVDYIMMSEYRKLDLDEDPCMIPPCGHLQAVSSMDGHMEMHKYYEMDGIKCLAINDKSVPYSMKEAKQCAKCRGNLRNMSRYGRIVRRALIDQSSKRFILWAREKSLELMQALHHHKQQLEESLAAAKSQFANQEVKIELAGSRENRMRAMNIVVNKRYKGMIKLHSTIAQHFHRVSVDEQPFKRVWDLAQHARRSHVTTDEMRWDPDAVQVGESLRVKSLLFRCDLAVIADFLSLGSKVKATIDFSQAKTECLTLIVAASLSHLHLQEAEGHVFYARYCAMERVSVAVDRIDEHVEEGKSHLQAARKLCQEYPGSTRLVMAELDEVEGMLRNATFYAPMNDKEWREVLAAMKKEWIGTGHWYTCENGHPFAVGECGGPMEETRCPECGSPVGGQDHRAARGVTHAIDLERQLGSLHL